jgi:hypothetical protein
MQVSYSKSFWLLRNLNLQINQPTHGVPVIQLWRRNIIIFFLKQRMQGLVGEVKAHEGSCVYMYWRRYPKTSAALSGLAPWWGADIFMCHAHWVGAHILFSRSFSSCCAPRNRRSCAVHTDWRKNFKGRDLDIDRNVTLMDLTWKDCECVNWIELAQDKIPWRATVKKSIKF